MVIGDGWSFLLVIVGPLFGSAIGAFFSSYLARKGSNAADKEDIKKLTGIVEDVKLSNAALLEEIKAGHQLRMAAVEKRLQAHQEAFTHWSVLMKGSYQKFKENHEAASDWWDEHCVFLDGTVRDEFVKYISRKNFEYSRIENENAHILQDWEADSKLPDAIFDAIKLPAMSVEKLIMSQPLK